MRRTIATILSITAISIAQVSLADNYQYELNGDAVFFETRGISEKDATLTGTYYFSPVTTSGVAYAEAAFLNRAANFGIHLENGYVSEDEQSLDYTYRYREKENVYGLNAESWFFNGYLYLSAQTRWFDAHRTGREVVDGVVTYQLDKNFNTYNSWSLNLGTSPIDGLLIKTRLYDGKFDSERWNIDVKYVTELLDHTINLELEFGEYYETDDIRIAADYYVTKALSVGLLYTQAKYIDKYEDVGARVRYFATPNFSVEAQHVNYAYGDGFTLGATGRF